MIKTETITISGRELIHTYSDAGMMILQNETGLEYDEAIDVPGKYTYTETDKPIEEDKDLTDSEALGVLLGREVTENEAQ